jgi:hypothetical protein
VIRISVSDLDSYRYWLADEESTLDDLVARLTHQAPPTPAMEAGRAFAKFMEHVDQGTDVPQATVDGWTFDFAPLGDVTLDMPDVRELKAEVVFQTPDGPVTLVGKVDGLDGVTVHDQKLTERWDAERYIDSLQWRSYLLMFGAQRFVYDVFIASYDRADPRLVHVRGYEKMPFYAYEGMRGDVQRAVEGLARVIVERGIDSSIRSVVENAAEAAAALGAKVSPAAQP